MIFGQRATGDRQRDVDVSTLLPEKDLANVMTPRLVTPLDEVQWHGASESRRVMGPGSESYWSRSRLAISGPRGIPFEVPRGFQLVATWDGVVSAVTDDTFVARISPLDGLGAEEEAEFLIDDVPQEDRRLLRPGALLYWFLGYETMLGRHRRTSELKIRRVTVVSEMAEAWADSISAIILDESESAPTEG